MVVWTDGLRTAVDLATRTFRAAREDRITAVAAQVAFFTLLALPPALLALAGLAGYIADGLGPEVSAKLRSRVVQGLGGFLAPDRTDELVRPTVDAIFTTGRGGALSIAGVVAVWSASRLVRSLIEALNVAYNVEEWRPAWKRRVLAVVLTAGGLFLLALFLPLVVAGPNLGRAIDDQFGLGGVVGAAWRVLYWPGAAAVGVCLLATLYHLAPNCRTRWHQGVPGAVLATVGWLMAAVGLRVYVRFSISEQQFGPLAAPVVLLLWFYASAIVVLLGAELNGEISKRRLTRSASADEGDQPTEGP